MLNSICDDPLPEVLKNLLFPPIIYHLLIDITILPSTCIVSHISVDSNVIELPLFFEIMSIIPQAWV